MLALDIVFSLLCWFCHLFRQASACCKNYSTGLHQLHSDNIVLFYLLYHLQIEKVWDVRYYNTSNGIVRVLLYNIIKENLYLYTTVYFKQFIQNNFSTYYISTMFKLNSYMKIRTTFSYFWFLKNRSHLHASELFT